MIPLLVEELAAAVVVSVHLFAAGALSASAWHKWRDLDGAGVEILDYRLTPRFLAEPLAAALAGLEAVAATALFAGVPAGAILAGGLFVLFAAAVVSALLRGLKIECHCSDKAEPIGSGLALRNLSIAAVLMATAAGGGGWLRPSHLDMTLAQALAVAFALAVVAAAYSIARVPPSARGAWGVSR